MHFLWLEHDLHHKFFFFCFFSFSVIERLFLENISFFIRNFEPVILGLVRFQTCGSEVEGVQLLGDAVIWSLDLVGLKSKNVLSGEFFFWRFILNGFHNFN